MRVIKFLFQFTFLHLITIIYAQNDCVDAIFICGNTNLTGVETNGFGVQEISFTNACSSQENNSIWLKVKIKTGGTFGFLITPENPDIVVDFDFWIYGPNTTCNNLGSAIRCSTTNPLAINQGNNLTGMNATETDVSEGPGFNGNSFVKWIEVLDNEIYYIAIDRPAGESDFAIDWTGTATLFSPPTIQNLIDLSSCDSASFPDTSTFDLTQNTSLAIGNQTGVSAIFYTNYNDAVVQMNPILNPNSFQNTSIPQTIYIRITDTITNCYVISDFNLNIVNNLIPVTNFLYKTPVCNTEINQLLPIVPNDFTTGGIFTTTQSGLSINPQTGTVDLTNSSAGTYPIIYTINQDNNICFIPQFSIFTLEIQNCIIPKGISVNNDFSNDFFNLENFDVKNLSIYNRYGVKVYNKSNYTNQWNGLSNNDKELPDGTYYYIIEQNNGNIKTGWVYLIRKN